MYLTNSNVSVSDCFFVNNSGLNGSGIYNDGCLVVVNSSFYDNCAKSYKLLSNNLSVTRGDVFELEVYLEYGDNFEGVYSVGDLIVDGDVPVLCCGAYSQQITLNLSNRIFISSTDKKGVARFYLNTENLSCGLYNFTLKHAKSSISTEITSSYTLQINEKVPDKNITSSKKIKKKHHKKVRKVAKIKGKSKKIFKNKKYKHKRNKIFKNKKRIHKKKNKLSKIFLKGYLFKSFKYSKNKKNNDLFAWLRNGYNGVRNILDFPLFKIPGYEKTLKSWGLAGEIVGVLGELFLGISPNGEVTLGNLSLTLLSVFCGAGFYLRGAKFLTSSLKLSKYLPKITKFFNKIGSLIKDNKVLQKTLRFIKDLPKIIGNSRIVRKVSSTLSNVEKSIKGLSKIVSNNKYVKRVVSFFKNPLKSIGGNKYVKKAFGVLNNVGSTIKKIPSYIKNLPKTIINSKYVKNGKNIITKYFNKFKESGKEYLTKTSKYLSNTRKNVRRVIKFIHNKSKTVLSNFNKGVSKVSNVLSWVSNPNKKIVSNVISRGVKSYTKYLRNIRKSRSSSKMVKSKAYIRSLFVNSVKTFLSNPVRAIYNVLFPNTKNIKNNINKGVKFINKHIINSHKSRSSAVGRNTSTRKVVYHPKMRYQNQKRTSSARYTHSGRTFYRPMRRIRIKKKSYTNPLTSIYNTGKKWFNNGVNKVKSFFKKFF